MINAVVVPQLFEGTRYRDGSFVVFGRVDRGIEGAGDRRRRPVGWRRCAIYLVAHWVVVGGGSLSRCLVFLRSIREGMFTAEGNGMSGG